MTEHLHSGQKIGRWTVDEDYIITPKGERKYFCRCQCGTERYVLERSLKHGGSLSCGCLREEQARKAVAYELTGQRFGDLTVICKSEKQIEGRGIFWHCKCSCGNTCEVMGSLMVTGRKTHCGCKTVKSQSIADISGQIFGRLTALYPTGGRSSNGSVIWHCRCECGNEVDVSYNDLLYSSLQSCGCLRKELDKALKDSLTHIDGTCLNIIKKRKLPANNTTGYRGVYLIKGKYMAKIVFQQKTYYLGTYEDIEDAVKARKEADLAIFQNAAVFYSAWLEKAEKEPEWAKKNPASVEVRRDRNNRLYLETEPELEEITGVGIDLYRCNT